MKRGNEEFGNAEWILLGSWEVPVLLNCTALKQSSFTGRLAGRQGRCGRQERAVLELPADSVEGLWDLFHGQDSLKGFLGRGGPWTFHGVLESDSKQEQECASLDN